MLCFSLDLEKELMILQCLTKVQMHRKCRTSRIETTSVLYGSVCILVHIKCNSSNSPEFTLHLLVNKATF